MFLMKLSRKTTDFCKLNLNKRKEAQNRLRLRRLYSSKRGTSLKNSSWSVLMMWERTLREEGPSLLPAIATSIHLSTSKKVWRLMIAWSLQLRMKTSLALTRGKWLTCYCPMRMYSSSCMRNFSQEVWLPILSLTSLIWPVQLQTVSIILGSDPRLQFKDLIQWINSQGLTRRTRGIWRIKHWKTKVSSGIFQVIWESKKKECKWGLTQEVISQPTALRSISTNLERWVVFQIATQASSQHTWIGLERTGCSQEGRARLERLHTPTSSLMLQI